MRVGHSISTDAAVPSGILLQLGYSTGWLDLVVSDEGGAGIGSLEAKVRPLHQHGARPMPLSLAVVAGAGYAYGAGAPALYGQLVLERDLLDRRLSFRADATGAISPGVAGSAALSAGAGFEFRPIPIHGVFAELRMPSADPARLQWAAGLRFYTRLHAFTLFATNTPSLSPWELASPKAQAIAIGGAFERNFLLPRKR